MSMMKNPCNPGGRSAFAVCVRLLVWTMVVVFSAPAGSVQAQGTPDPQNTVYATGAVFETEQDLVDKPRTPLFRAFLPEFVDHIGRFPIPGHQGRQSSCVGWAVGYAARSYYNSAPQGGQRLTADRIPSPAYIYDSIRSPGYACDRGTKISDALELLKKGALAHAEYPYDQNLCRRPGTDVAVRASRFRIADWQSGGYRPSRSGEGGTCERPSPRNRHAAQQRVSPVERRKNMACRRSGRGRRASRGHRGRLFGTRTVLHGHELLGSGLGRRGFRPDLVRHIRETGEVRLLHAPRAKPRSSKTRARTAKAQAQADPAFSQAETGSPQTRARTSEAGSARCPGPQAAEDRMRPSEDRGEKREEAHQGFRGQPGRSGQSEAGGRAVERPRGGPPSALGRSARR